MWNLLKVDEQKVSWDDSTCKLIHMKFHQKSYHCDIEYHITLHTILCVVGKAKLTARIFFKTHWTLIHFMWIHSHKT